MASNDYVYSLTSEIKRLKDAFDIIADKLVIADAKIRLDHENALEADELLSAKDAELERLKGLLRRAADALQLYADYPISMVMSVGLRERAEKLLPELRKAD